MKPNRRITALHMAALILVVIAVFIVYSSSQYRKSSSSVSNGGVLSGKCIALDPGHGGYDGGAEGADGISESNLNLQICLYLEQELLKQGAKVVLTRYEDIALANSKRPDMKLRNEIVENSRADIALSIHLNAHPDRSISGPMVYFTLGDKKSEALCRTVQDALNAELKPKKDKIIHSGDYYFLGNGTQPRIIVECGFISNPTEEAFLVQPEYQQRIAKAILSGILKYFSQVLPD